MTIGKNFVEGRNCIIDPYVVIGNNVTLGHNVVLRSGTTIGNDVNIADFCCTTGLCYIGNHVNIRTQSVISKGVIIEDCAFIGAGIMSSHTNEIYHQRSTAPKVQLITRIGYGAVIGSRVNISAGVQIGNNVIVGYSSFVNKNLLPEGIYYGCPATMKSRVKDLVPVDPNWAPHFFSAEQLKQYLPYAL
jgi:acetyltransferase-like isoleucine patch superfamily enzyme